MNLVTVTDPKGQVTTHSYDALNRLTQSTTIDNIIGLTYDPGSNLLTVTDGDSDLAFAHDGLNRVLTASTGAGGVQPQVTLTHAFDVVGNRSQRRAPCRLNK